MQYQPLYDILAAAPLLLLGRYLAEVLPHAAKPFLVVVGIIIVVQLLGLGLLRLALLLRSQPRSGPGPRAAGRHTLPGNHTAVDCCTAGRRVTPAFLIRVILVLDVNATILSM